MISGLLESMMGKPSAVRTNYLGLLTMQPDAIAKVRAFEQENMLREQTPITTHHLFHSGMYSRTIMIPAGVVLTGALIKLATTLIVYGDATVFIGAGCIRLAGYHVLSASANRKQAFVAHADTWLTMSFATHARSVEEAEAEFTDEDDLLFSRRGENVVNITGE